MLLSSLMKQIGYSGKYEIINEKPFKYLALIESTIKQPNCVYIEDEKYIYGIKDTVALIVTTEKILPLLGSKPVGFCVVDRPRELFFDLHNYLSGKEGYARPKYKTMIGQDCRISSKSSIASSNVRIGNNVTIEEFAVIRENTSIGDNSIIRAGCIIGGHGFEFKRRNFGIISVDHAGGVVIGDHVEIQYNTCVDRAVFPWDDTVIGDYCKIDNLVHIAHGVKMANSIMVVANAGIGGRTIIGEGTWIGFSATVTNGIFVGEKARANIGSVVTKSIPASGSVTGNFAIEHDRFIHNLKKSLRDDA